MWGALSKPHGSGTDRISGCYKKLRSLIFEFPHSKIRSFYVC
ncbi:hypothetical protein [Klebsiella phage KpF5]|nr:hypothetical protein [Klebsiella phage KpF5]